MTSSRTRSPETQKRATGNGQPATGNEEPTHHASVGHVLSSSLRIGSNIAQRMIGFASEVIHVARTLPKDVGTRHVAQQVVRSATSVGANYEEARAAESKSDFIHKLSISAKELRETMYWLDLIDHARMTSADLAALQQEATELAAIIGASIRTTRRNQQR